MKLETTIALRVKAERIKSQLTQEDLAAATGLAGVTIGVIEQGHRTPSIATLGRIAKALRVAPWELLKPEG